MPVEFIKKIGNRILRRKQATPAAAVKPEPPAVADMPPPSPPARPARSRRRSSRPARKPEDGPSSRPEPPRPPQPEWSLDQFVIPPKEGHTRFHDLDLPAQIMHGVADLGFEYCTPVQAESLRPSLAGRNVAAQAQTGTGKTAAFLIALFTRFLRQGDAQRTAAGKPRALIIAPTRELVIQIAKDAEHVGKYCPYRCVAVYGGMDFAKQERDLRQPVDIVAATPGRLLDFKNRHILDLSSVDTLVIDEADRMLDMGFIPDVRRIISATRPKEQRQTMLFSATLSDDVMRLAKQWMPEPVPVEIAPESIAVDTVDQVVYSIASRYKYTLLYNLLARKEMKRVLVFGNRRTQTQHLVDRLQAHNIKCELLSGAVAQNKRMRILEQFREGDLPVLVATDVAARGLHIDGVSHVINYDFPYESESYVHRIGRTGRAGAFGTAISFACEDESFIIPEIEKFIGHALHCEVPAEELFTPPPRPTHVVRTRPREDRSAGGSRTGSRRPPSRGGPRRSSPRGR